LSIRKDELLTSTLTLGEVMAKPLELGQRDLAYRYDRFLNSPGVQLVSFDRDAARVFAAIRNDRTIRPPDAIQLSCAAVARTSLFITNDARLSQKTISGVDLNVPLESVFL